MSIYKGNELVAGNTTQGPRGYTGKDAAILRQVLSLPDTSLDRDYTVPKSAFSRIVVAGDTFTGFADTEDGAHSYAIIGAVTAVGETDYTLRVLSLTRDITGEQGPAGLDGIGALSKGLFQLVVDDDGNLFAEYNDIDGGEPPQFDYDEETGDLYYVIGED